VKAWGDGGLYSYTFAFDPVAKRVTTTNSLGAAATAQLDDLACLSGKWTRRWHHEIRDDERGRTVEVTDRTATQPYRYDESGNLLELTRADARVIRMTFDDERPYPSRIRTGDWCRMGRPLLLI